MKHNLLILTIAFFSIIGVMAECKKECRYEYGECPDITCANYIKADHTYETDDTKFYNGEILAPDYVHKNWLVVTNADSLNWAMEYYDAGSDGDIMDLLRAYCVPMKTK